MTAETTLLADIGGTNARFALLAGGKIGPISYLATRDYPHFADALAAYLKQQGGAKPEQAVLAVAGVVDQGRCALTNNPWVIDAAELRAPFGFGKVELVNDFAAVAWSLARLPDKYLRPLPEGQPRHGAPMLAIGPGTGLGVAAYVPGAGAGIVLTTEAGHMTLPAGSAREDAVINELRREFGHVSAERVLSGPGLQNLYRAVCAIDQVSLPPRSAAEVTQAARDGSCPVCRATVDMFCALLGTVAGDLALAFAARGGVFIAGGVTHHIADDLPRTAFRERFEAKGRMRGFVETIPVSLLLHDDAPFIGLRVLAERR